jgi:hypothetical protein
MIFIVFFSILAYPFYHNEIPYLESNLFKQMSLIGTIIFTTVMIIYLKKRCKLEPINKKQILPVIIIGILYATIFHLINPVKIDFNILVLLETGLLAPIMEELLYRGVIYQNMNLKYKGIMNIILFTLSHDISNMLFAFFLSIILMVAYNKTKSLKAPILIHISCNMTSLLLETFL